MNLLILGIGNILFQDEGIGVHFIHYLDEKYHFESKSATVSIIDGGTLAQRLIPEIVKYDQMIVIDCIDADDSKAGDVYFFDYHKAPSYINWQGSAHEVEMLQTLNMIDMNNDLPKTFVLGIVPKRISDDTTFELSQEMILAIATMENAIFKHLQDLNIQMRLRKKVTIEEVCQYAFKRTIINEPCI